MKSGFNLLIFAIIALVLASYVAYTDWTYLTQGQETDGVIVEIETRTRRSTGRYSRGKMVDYKVATYTYEDNGTELTGTCELRPGLEYQDKQTVPIQYIPGSWQSRLAATKKTGFMLIPLILGLLALGGGVYQCRRGFW